MYSRWRILEFFFLIIVTTDAFGICFPFALLLIRRGRQSLCGSNSNLKEFSNIVANGVFWTFLLKNIDTVAFGICFPFALLLTPCGTAGFVAFITVLKRIVQLYSHWRVWIFSF